MMHVLIRCAFLFPSLFGDAGLSFCQLDRWTRLNSQDLGSLGILKAKNSGHMQIRNFYQSTLSLETCQTENVCEPSCHTSSLFPVVSCDTPEAPPCASSAINPPSIASSAPGVSLNAPDLDNTHAARPKTHKLDAITTLLNGPVCTPRVPPPLRILNLPYRPRQIRQHRLSKSPIPRIPTPTLHLKQSIDVAQTKLAYFMARGEPLYLVLVVVSRVRS